MLGVYVIRLLIARYVQEVARYLCSFSCSESRVCSCTIKVVLPHVYFWRCSHEKKYQALHACTTSMFAFWSVGAWERGYSVVHLIMELVISDATYCQCERYIGAVTLLK